MGSGLIDASGFRKFLTQLLPSDVQPPDEKSLSGDNERMSSITREEINAKLEATEARMDARFSGMSAKLDTALAEMRADREANTIRFAAMAKDIGDIKGDLKTVAADSKAQFKTVIGNVWGASIATITVVGATLAIAISSFDSGRETSKNIAEATVRMEKLQAQLEAQASKVTTPPAK
ncbi:hypothetical protein [Pantoea sp. 18069]|uniref:hypothetical protein n=1 Tax=Pantoea sp. 18069 TaxID=2681415 RepID=UPI0013578785|nr:hypothetical protein [Pantoea sp. 18069]